MLTSCNGAGLSINDRKILFECIKGNGTGTTGLLSQYSTSHALWSDFERRFLAVQVGVGNFQSLPIHYDSFLKGLQAKTGEEARVRDIQLSVKFIFENLCRSAKHGTAEEKDAISKHVRYEAHAQTGGPVFENMKEDHLERKYGSIWTADGALRLQHRCRLEDTHSSQDAQDHPLGPVCLLLVALFVDKHNVTKLNKRSLYSVVMFVKNIDSGPLQFLHSMIVAYIPFPSSLTDLGTRLSKPNTRHIRRMAVQQTMQHLLASATSGGTIFTMTCPDSKVRRFRIAIIGNADHPEVCMQTSGRSGTGIVGGSARPDPQCNLLLRHSGFYRRPDSATLIQPRTASKVLAVYENVALETTLKAKELILKENSLNMPPSAWLNAPFVQLPHGNQDVDSEPDVIAVPVRSNAGGKVVTVGLSVENFGFTIYFRSSISTALTLGPSLIC